MNFNEKIILSNNSLMVLLKELYFPNKDMIYKNDDKLSIIRDNDESITVHFDDLDLSFLHDGVV